MTRREVISLGELQIMIREGIESALPSKYWIKAETGEVKIHSAGHCYIDLIERNPDDSAVTAKVSAIIWASRFRLLKPFFESSTGRNFERGLTILVEAQATYSSLYGLSLIISDIDPSYTLGEQELARQRTIALLEEEGMFGLNSALEIPLLPRRVALISSATAAGYRDFVKHSEPLLERFNIELTLFQAPMQGDSAPRGIIEQMERVAATPQPFDLLFILRGGGSVQDLSCFDDYNLAINVAQFPIAVITAIGHDHDYHVIDMVAHTWVKTPTAGSDLLNEFFTAQEQQLHYLARRVSIALRGRLQKEEIKVQRAYDRMVSALKSHWREHEYKLQSLEQRVIAASPSKTMERGFSIAVVGGKRATSVKHFSVGDKFTLILTDGSYNCTINSLKKREDEKPKL